MSSAECVPLRTGHGDSGGRCRVWNADETSITCEFGNRTQVFGSSPDHGRIHCDPNRWQSAINNTDFSVKRVLQSRMLLRLRLRCSLLSSAYYTFSDKDSIRSFVPRCRQKPSVQGFFLCGNSCFLIFLLSALIEY